MKDNYTPQEAARATLNKIKELAKYHLDKANAMGITGIPSEKASKGIAPSTAPKVPSLPSLPKPPKPMAKFLTDRKGKMGKSNENPDEKQDALLGEKVEKDVVEHIIGNREDEKKEGIV